MSPPSDPPRLDLRRLPRLLASRDPSDIAAALAQAHQRGSPAEARQQLLEALVGRPSGRAQAVAAKEPEDLYATAREHFGRAERRLAEEAAVTERLLAGLRGAPTPSPQPAARPTPPVVSQQHVVMQVPVGARGLGRFDVTNGLGRRCRLSFRPSEVRVQGTEEAAWLPVAFDPPRPALEAAERVRVSIAVDPSALAAGPGAVLELDVDVLADDEPVLKVWVELHLSGPLDAP